jgi:glycosyltransferase involved in cell wall biosynthesis
LTKPYLVRLMASMKTKILLLQDAVYLPSFGGGNKANRLLMRELVALGFDCHVVARVPGLSQHNPAAFLPQALAARGAIVREDERGQQHYTHEGVTVQAIDTASVSVAAELNAIIHRERPDWILVSDDHRAVFLEAALTFAKDRTVVVVHTHFHLPFGPESRALNPEQHARMRQARDIVVVSDYSRGYLRQFGGLEATLLRFPVFGAGPFEVHGKPDTGYVTMINPCVLKGLPIFLDLVDHFPDVAFAAVPTWGADDAVMSALNARANVTLLEAADEIDTVLRHARIVVAPSLVPETFGYVAVDAMLRGIPVLAGGLGGQTEAKLGVDFILPVCPIEQIGDQLIVPAQDFAPWRAALSALLSDAEIYQRSAKASRDAALCFLPETDARHFAEHLRQLADQPSSSSD